jgi:hypothetical protein
MMKLRNAYNISVRKPQGKKSLEDLDIHDRIILKFIIQKEGMNMWTGPN